MSTAEATRTETRAPRGTTFGNVVRSEWTKFWAVRSTAWSLLIMVIVTLLFGVLVAWAVHSSWDQVDASERASFDPTNTALSGMMFGQLVAGVLGVLIISTEYSTGAIRVSLAAVPRRLQFLFAKCVVVAPVVLLVGLVASFAAFFLCMPFFSSFHRAASLGDDNVLRALIGGALYLMGCALFGLAVGSIVRNTAGSITAVVALLFVLPLLTNAIPGSVGDTVQKYFTQNAGSQVAATVPPGDMLGPWAGYAVFTLEWAVLLAVGAVLLSRRDA